MSYTYALLQVSDATYDEIEKALKDAGYDEAFHIEADTERKVIDMHGIALERKSK